MISVLYLYLMNMQDKNNVLMIRMISSNNKFSILFVSWQLLYK